jgi:hypothetical protein
MILKAVKPSPKSAGSKSSRIHTRRLDLRQEAFYRSRRRKGKKDYTGKQWTKELIEFFWTHGNTLGKIGAKWHMP